MKTPQQIRNEVEKEKKKIETEVSMPKIHNKLDILIAIDILWCKLFDGWACEKCGIIQGEPRKGWDKYYCKHLELPLHTFLKPIEKRIMKDIGIDLKQKGVLK